MFSVFFVAHHYHISSAVAGIRALPLSLKKAPAAIHIGFHLYTRPRIARHGIH